MESISEVSRAYLEARQVLKRLEEILPTRLEDITNRMQKRLALPKEKARRKALLSENYQLLVEEILGIKGECEKLRVLRENALMKGRLP